MSAANLHPSSNRLELLARFEECKEQCENTLFLIKITFNALQALDALSQDRRKDNHLNANLLRKEIQKIPSSVQRGMSKEQIQAVMQENVADAKKELERLKTLISHSALKLKENETAEEEGLQQEVIRFIEYQKSVSPYLCGCKQDELSTLLNAYRNVLEPIAKERLDAQSSLLSRLLSYTPHADRYISSLEEKDA